MTRFLLALTAASVVALVPVSSATAADCRPGLVCDTVCSLVCDPPCQACIEHVDPCDIVRCTPPCILGVTC